MTLKRKKKPESEPSDITADKTETLAKARNEPIGVIASDGVLVVPPMPDGFTFRGPAACPICGRVRDADVCVVDGHCFEEGA